jgi:hypothetical protein
MSRRPLLPALLAMPLLLLQAACQQAPSSYGGAPGGAPGGGTSVRADAAAIAYCRQQAEDVYNAQHRSARIQSDTRDSPFSGAYLAGSSSRTLSDRYAMDTMIGDCLRNSAARQAGADTSVTAGQATTPAAAPTAAPARPLPSGPAGGPPVAARTSAPAGVPLERAPPPPPPARN